MPIGTPPRTLPDGAQGYIQELFVYTNEILVIYIINKAYNHILVIFFKQYHQKSPEICRGFKPMTFAVSQSCNALSNKL